MIGLAAFSRFLAITGEIDSVERATAAPAAAIADCYAEPGWPEWASYGTALVAAILAGLLNS
jgi:hypothetical protein